MLKCKNSVLFVAIIALSTVVADAQVTFNYDATRVSSIKVNETEILTGGGVYLVGSKTGVDNPTTNYTTVGSNGTAMTNSGPPFKLTFWKKSDTTLGFKAEVGPVAGPIDTLSLPFDFNKQQISKFAFNGGSYYLNASNTGTPYTSGNYVAHSTIPAIYPIYQNGVLLGHSGVATTRQPTTWGAVDGTLASVRINVINHSHYRSMGFFNHFGTNNAEIQFGKFVTGEKATVEGELVVIAKASSGWTYQAESQMSHQIGRLETDSWSVRVGDTVNRYMCYGPYTTSISPGTRSATFRLMLDNTTADNNKILTLDVFDVASGRVLASRGVTRREFSAGPFRFQDFVLNFTAATGQRLEFRTFWHGGSYARQDFVKVK